MSSTRTELELLLHNISRGLKRYSIKELNIAISELLEKSSHGKHEEIDFLLNQVCTQYNITRRILKNSREHGEVAVARKLSYCLLHDLLGLRQRYIAINLFDRTPRAVFLGITYFRNLNPKIEDDRTFKERYDKLNKLFIEYIAKKNN